MTVCNSYGEFSYMFLYSAACTLYFPYISFGDRCPLHLLKEPPAVDAVTAVFALARNRLPLKRYAPAPKYLPNNTHVDSDGSSKEKNYLYAQFLLVLHDTLTGGPQGFCAEVVFHTRRLPSVFRAL